MHVALMSYIGPMEGDRAPDFSLPEASERIFSLSEQVRKGPVVLIFYPTDFGITCTVQFKKLNEMFGSFTEAGASLIGISVNSTHSHRAWKERLDLNFPLLSDLDAAIAKAYDVMCPEDSILKGHATRAIFIVDKDQVVRYRWIPPDQHMQPDYDLVLEMVRRA